MLMNRLGKKLEGIFNEDGAKPVVISALANSR